MRTQMICRWWLIFLLVILGYIIMWNFGIWGMLYKFDVTKLSFIMLVLFSGFTIYIGMLTYRVYGGYNMNVKSNAAIVEWFGLRFPVLGILGTAIGITYMIYNADFSKDIGDIIPYVLNGLGTALFTTITGIVCCYLIELQLFNLSREYNDG